MYIVKFISNDDQVFEYRTEAQSEMEAVNKGEEAIAYNNWEDWNYVLDSIEEVKQDQVQSIPSCQKNSHLEEYN